MLDTYFWVSRARANDTQRSRKDETLEYPAPYNIFSLEN